MFRLTDRLRSKSPTASSPAGTSAWSDRTKGESPSSANPDINQTDLTAPQIPLAFHLLTGGGLVVMVLLHRYASDYYNAISQEDHIVEWMSAVFYLAAGVIGVRYAIKHRRVFDGLVALFCLFYGGEEFSWGQRLLGFAPAKYFMENNVQQEVNLHNLFGVRGHDVAFSLILGGYCLLLPLLARHQRFKQILDKLGATSFPLGAAPWALFLIILYLWYPFHLSSEWIETISAGFFLAGSVFLSSKALNSKATLLGFSLVVVVSLVLTNFSNAQAKKHTPERVACAKAEVQNLLDDIIHGEAATDKLRNYDAKPHRRVFAAHNQGYLHGDRLPRFNETRCEGSADPDTQLRHRYAIDPWGLSYWLHVIKLPDGSLELTVYSFGPNRRRDNNERTPGTPGSPNDDDIGVTGVLMGNAHRQQPIDSSPPVFSMQDSH